MSDQNESKNRFISGVVNRCHLSKPYGQYENYSVHIDGAWDDDTSSLYDGYLNSKYPVKVYNGGEDPIDPTEAEGKKFLGRCMVIEKIYQGKTYRFLTAVSIEKIIGDDEKADNDPFKDGNPFLKNPLK